MEIKNCLLKLDELQASAPFTSTEQQLEIMEKISSLWRIEEQYWHQMSRINWLKVGDSNSRFFHLTTIHRRQRNRILKIQNDAEVWVAGEKNIRREFETQFKAVFKSQGPQSWGNALSGVNCLVSAEMNSSLSAPFTIEEVKEAVFQLGALKAPGPDGFPGLFYHKYWSTVNEVVVAASKEFGANTARLHSLNRTHIALIPKVPNPEKTTQFRPISLCNNSYKILSKLLANRLKAILPHIISTNQNAFVPDRKIQDNLMLAHETYHYLRLKREGGNHEFGLKLDMNKAYDRVEWDFLEAALLKFGFSRGWVNLIMSCVSTVSSQ
ncbi:putative RNA-directed DNA polymerase [Rosa chinensis]|uniref:Putative RNA-directed DNA polymerase n=1 Tax=Rosa chinensis TaxID=74649 RepID=A0A2P6PAA9_ROSCH|nr:putative RNA-directed DNA polymerase [Rosa chinensis]